MHKLVNKYIIAIILFYIFWLGLLPLLLTKTVTVLCRNLSHNSDYQINIDNPSVRLYFTPILKFKANSFAVKSKISDDVVRADNLYVKIRILPLLSGRLHINILKSDNMFIKKELQKEAVLNKNFFENLKNIRYAIDNINLVNFNSIFTAEDTVSPIVYSGQAFNFNKRNRYLKLSMDSKLVSKEISSRIFLNLFLPKNNNIDKTNFDIEISNLDLKFLGEFFKNFLPNEILGIDGKTDIFANKQELKMNFSDFKILYKNNDYSVIFPQRLFVKSKFSIIQDCINLKSTEIKANNKVNLQLNGTIKDYFGKTLPDFDLHLIINKSKVEDLVQMIPPFKVEEFDCYKLKKYKFYGNILGNLSITGKPPEPNINGKIFINEGILIKPIPNATSGATIKLAFTGRNVNYDVNVPAGNGQKVWVKGTQELYNVKYADLTVKSTNAVDLHSAEEVVNPLHEILNFVVGPLPILNVYGNGNINLLVKGNRTSPHAWGVLNFNNTDVNFIEIPDLKLKGAEASINFNDSNAIFKTTKGTVNNKDFSITGTCNFNGEFDFDAVSENQPAYELYNAIQTSTMLDDIKKMIPKVDSISGLADLKLKIYGTVKYIEDLKLNKNAFAKGSIKLKNNVINVQGVVADKVNAEIKPDGTSATALIKAYIGESPLNISAKIKNNIAELSANIPKFNLNYITGEYNPNNNCLPIVSINARYKGDINEIEYDKLNFDAKIIPQTSELLNFNSGQILMNNGKLAVKNLDFYINNPSNRVNTNFQISDLFTQTPQPNGILRLNISDLRVLNEIFGKKFLPEKFNNILKDYEFENGSLNINAKFNNGKITTESDLSGLRFNYLPLELPIEIINGKFSIKDNDLKLKTFNILADKMPIMIDGEIKDVTDKQMFNLYLNSKPRQDFIDKFVNKNNIYPLKIKGDIIYKAILKGVPNDYDLESEINLAKESSIYYYGATVGDIENAITLNLDSKIRNKRDIKIREFLYDKIIDSQNGKQTNLNMLKVKGGFSLLKDDIEFKDLHVKTSNPTDVRIFNLIFGKPNIKQGQFTSDFKMRGKLSNPKIIGDFHIVETNIPFLDTTMKNIEFLFKDRTLEIKSKGEVFGNDVSAEAILKNKLTKPYNIEKAIITTKDMNLNRIVDKLKSAEADNEQSQDNIGNFDINSIVANSIKLKADNVILRNIHATDFDAEISLNENRLLEMKNFKFNIAQGHLNGNYSYNLKNDYITLNMDADSISANDITWAIFDLQNQIFGDMTGKIELACNGKTFEGCMKTLSGNTTFNVKDGRMPKLGSLEYLLKAGNLVKGGITGLSINSVADLISPMRTGEFSDIFGTISIKDGVAENIEITTQGKDLSLFICGTYNLSTSIADMEVLGLLSRKISTMLGPIGNISVNTLFNLIPGVDLSKESELIKNINKIPGIELSNKAYRKFVAKIMGNINGDDYVTSFKWIN